MDSRERIARTLKGELPDRVGVYEHFWGTALDRFKREGMPEGEDAYDYFDLDIAAFCWMDQSFRFPSEVVERTDEYEIDRDANGVLAKRLLCDGHTPYWIDHRLKTRDDWRQHRGRLSDLEGRFPSEAVESYSRARKKGKFAVLTGLDPYECTWQVLGQDVALTAMVEHPDWMYEVFDTYSELCISIAGGWLDRGMDFDGLWLYGDIGYRNATLFSPKLYRELLKPAHRKVCNWAKSRGKVVILHSCGRIQEVLSDFIEAGFAAIHPLEAKVGQDIRELRKVYGDSITFFGNIDVQALSGTKKEIYEEIMPKLKGAASKGRYIFHSDHSLPHTVSLENYRYALDLARGFKFE